MKRKLCALALLAALIPIPLPLPAEIGTGDSATGLLETIAPSPGTPVVPAIASTTPILIPFSGATDAHHSVASVELWYRTDSTPWTSSGETVPAASGTFGFVPPGTSPANSGTYYIQLIAHDTVGNRGARPSGMVGSGQGSVNFAAGSAVSAHWNLFE